MNGGLTYMRTDRGFMLIELLVAMAVAVILFAATYSVYVVYENQVARGRMTITGREDARAVLNMMATEIQMAGFPHQTGCVSDPTNVVVGGNNPFQTATAATARFRMDANQDGDCADANEDITYTLTGTQITRNGRSADPGSAAQPLLDNVTALSFQYWCATNPGDAPVGPVASYGTAPCNAGMRIVRVDISVTVVNPRVPQLAIAGGETRPTAAFATSVIPRNMFVL